jgi:hypothetical protein
MYASSRGSLEAIKSWGGWSTGEQGGATYHYLLEEYSKIEYDNWDMLSPFRRDRNIAAIDETIADQAVTRSLFESTHGILNTRLTAVENLLRRLDTRLENLGNLTPSRTRADEILPTLR